MSQYVDDIIKDIWDNPETWLDYEGHGCKKDRVIIKHYGNTKLLSVIDVYIQGKHMPVTYLDRYKLEKAVGRWYKSMSLEHLKKYE